MSSGGKVDQLSDLTITNRSQVRQAARRFCATHLVSLLDPGTPAYRPSRVLPANHLRLFFVDHDNPKVHAAPQMCDVEAILAFGSRLSGPARPVISCEAGRSRSVAAAFLLLVQRFGIGHASQALDYVYAVRPQASPNRLMVRYGDDLLGAHGRLVALVEEARRRPRPLEALADGEYPGSEE